MFNDLHPRQREKMADMFLDLSKILFASFVIGPFISDHQVLFPLVVVGILCSTVTWMMGIVLAKPRED